MWVFSCVYALPLILPACLTPLFCQRWPVPPGGMLLSLPSPFFLPQSSELLTEALPAAHRALLRAHCTQAVWCIAVFLPPHCVNPYLQASMLLENKVRVQTSPPCNLADLSCCVSHNFLICGLDVGHAQQLVVQSAMLSNGFCFCF